MIRITRLDGTEAVVNSDLILVIEETPDTVLTFLSGQHMVVKDSAEDVVAKAVAFRRRIHTGLQVVGKDR